MKKIIAAASLTLLLTAGTGNAAQYIDMNIGTQSSNASVSFDGNNGDSLIGSNISVDYLVGNEMPSNSGTHVTLDNAVLNFNSGAFISRAGKSNRN